jgi:hypothetical protein
MQTMDDGSYVVARGRLDEHEAEAMRRHAERDQIFKIVSLNPCSVVTVPQPPAYTRCRACKRNARGVGGWQMKGVVVTTREGKVEFR